MIKGKSPVKAFPKARCAKFSELAGQIFVSAWVGRKPGQFPLEDIGWGIRHLEPVMLPVDALRCEESAVSVVRRVLFERSQQRDGWQLRGFWHVKSFLCSVVNRFST